MADAPISQKLPGERSQTLDPLTVIVYAAVVTCIIAEPILMCLFLF